MASFFSDDDDDAEDNAEDSHSGEDAAMALAGAVSPRLSMVSRTSANSAASQQSNRAPPALKQPGAPSRSGSKTVTVFSDDESRSPPALQSGSKSVTVFSDDESSADDVGKGRVQELVRSNSELRRQSDQLRKEVDTWKGKAESLGGQVDELQEQVEESEQSWSHEQHKRKSEWEDLRGRLEGENEVLQRRLNEWVPMQHEDERSQLLREVLNTVSRTREALQNQGSELVSYSEQISEENRKLEDHAQAQALCLEEQQSTAERLRTELQQLGAEARELREAEQRAQAAALESEASIDNSAELKRLREELHCTPERERELLERLSDAEAKCEALAQSLETKSDSAQLEQQAVDLLLQEKTKCHELESTCQRLEEELSEGRGAEGQSLGHWESSCLRLEEELSQCRKAELSELSRLEEQLTEHRQSDGSESRSFEEQRLQLEEELQKLRHAEGSECERLRSAHEQLEELGGQRLAEARRELLEELAESRHLESLEFRRLQGVCSRLEEELRAAADAESDEAAASAPSPAEEEDEEEQPPAVQARRASGTFAVLACAYAAAAAACEPPHAKEGAPLDEELQHPRKLSGSMEALNWAYAAAETADKPVADRGLGAARPEGGPAAPAAEAGRWYAKEMAEQRLRAEAEVAESHSEIARLRAELATQEAEHVVVPDRGPELRLKELEARCEASEEEVRRMHGLLEERRAESRSPRPSRASGAGPSEARLAAALKRRQACRAWNASLKAAYVEVTLPPRPGGAPLGQAEQVELQGLLARALSSYDVEPSDIEVCCLKDSLRCEVHIRGCRTVRAVCEALARTLESPEGNGDLLAIFAEEGSPRGRVQVAPKWPLERLQAEIEFEYGYMLTMSQLEKLVPVVAESHSLYEQACDHARSRAPYELEALECWWSKASFEGSLLPIEEGQRRHLLEDILEQGAFRLADFVEDAGQAQLSLKAQLAPDTAWARSALNDLEEVPADHAQRFWQSGAGDPAPNGRHYDPGLEAEDHVLEEAQRRTLPLDEEPGVHRLLGASRLDLLFESIECLQQSMDWISSHLDVLWIDNGFWNPPCLGCRDVRIGVRQLVPSGAAPGAPQRPHISELRLLLKEMQDVRQGEGRQLYDHICSILLQCGVRQKDVAGVRKIALRVLDTTDGWAALEARRDLRCTLSALELHADSVAEATALLAGELRREARAQATAAGVSQEQIARIEGAARRAGSRQEVRRPDEVEAQQQRSADGQAEEHLQQQVSELQQRCGDLEGTLSTRQAENEWLKAEVERLTLQAEAAALTTSVPHLEESPSPEELLAVRSELAQAEALGQRMQESEAAHAEQHRRAATDAESVRQQLQAAEARALALSEELKQSQEEVTALGASVQNTGRHERELIAPGTLEPCVVEEPFTPVPGYSKQPPTGRNSPSKSANERRRLAGLAHNSASAVAKLLKEVRGLNDAHAVLAGGGQDAPSAASRLSAVKELEKQTCQLERTNHEWASAVAGRSPGPGLPCDASGGQDRPDSVGTDASLKEALSPMQRGAALTSALQHTARRLETLQGRLKDLAPT